MIKFSAISHQVKLSKETFFELCPNPPNGDVIALDRFLVKFKAANKGYYAIAIASYVRVKKVCITASSEHQILLEFYEGRKKTTRLFPASILDPKEIRAVLEYGILFDSSYAKDLVLFLMQNMQTAPLVRYYSQLGWAKDGKGETYYLQRPIGKYADGNYEYHGDLDIIPHGDLEVWKKMIETEVIGNEALTFLTVLSFTSPILSLINDRLDVGECLVVNLNNQTSKGKTTAAMLMSSIYCRCTKW